MSNPQQTHGAFSWCELQTSDPQKATAFYVDVLGWETEQMAMPMGDYTLLKAGGQPVGGVMQQPDGPTQWASYVTVDDVDASVTRAIAKGATLIAEAMDVPGVGRMAGFIDPFGATLWVITYESVSKQKAEAA